MKLVTVGELAKQLNISTQAIYAKINDSMKDELTNHIHKIAKGKRFVIMIDEEGVEIIENSIVQVADEQLTSIDKEIIALLQTNIELLQEQLNVKDLQIAELNNRLMEAQNISKHNLVLLQNEKEVKAIEENKGLWQRFKESFKRD